MTVIDLLRDHPRRTAVLLAYAFVVFVASVAPAPPGTLAPTGPFGVVALDKWIHASGYAGLGFVVAYATQARQVRDIGRAVVVAAAFGAGIELVQAALPYRTFSLLDMGANAFGAVVGGVVWYVATRLQTGS